MVDLIQTRILPYSSSPPFRLNHSSNHRRRDTTLTRLILNDAVLERLFLIETFKETDLKIEK